MAEAFRFAQQQGLLELSTPIDRCHQLVREGDQRACDQLVPEPQLPSHQGPDAQLVDPELDVVTIAIQVPETLGHLHAWSVELTREATKEEVLAALSQSSRILLIDTRTGLSAINAVKEWMSDSGRPNANLYEVARWSDLLTVKSRELFYCYMVDNQAIVIPETIDAIRALAGWERDPHASIAATNGTLGIGALTVPHSSAAEDGHPLQRAAPAEVWRTRSWARHRKLERA